MVSESLGNLYKIINSLNGRQFNELNKNMKDLLCFLYGNSFKDNEVIVAYKGKYPSKANLVIQVGEVKKGINIKSGDTNLLHVETIESFITFLESLHLDKETTNFIKFYHYGDNTLDGSGNKKMNSEEIKFRFHNEISFYNETLNKDEIIVKIAERAMFLNMDESLYDAAYIYYGDEFQGIYASKEEVITYLLANKEEYLKNLHFSSLSFHPLWRNGLDNNDERMKLMAIRWFNMANCLYNIHYSRLFKNKNSNTYLQTNITL